MGAGDSLPWDEDEAGRPEPTEVDPSFRLDKIGGLIEQKDELIRSIILPLVHPTAFKAWGVDPPKGIIFHGPPGTGKTFLAKALVNELKALSGKNVNFFLHKGAETNSMWFGESQKNLRNLFRAAASMSPSILFFDEIDGLCPTRDTTEHTGRKDVVTAFLGAMDEVPVGQVFVVAATNRLAAVDPAVRRPGRFDRHLAFGLPDEKARAQILQVHTSAWDRDDAPSAELITDIAARSPGLSGADLEKLCKDVVYKAMDAHGGNMSEEVKVTRATWLETLKGIRPSALNTFGSALAVPSQPREYSGQLLAPIVAQVVKKCGGTLTKTSLELQEVTMMDAIQKGLLLHLGTGDCSSFLNNGILQGVLTDPLFAGATVFELSTGKVIDEVFQNKVTFLGAVCGIVKQARDAQRTGKWTVVAIPNLNELLDAAKGMHVPSSQIIEALEEITGPKIFLLATLPRPLEYLDVNKMSSLFGPPRELFRVRNPNARELQTFFAATLAGFKEPLGETEFTWVVTEVGKFAEGKTFEAVLHLNDRLLELDLGAVPSSQLRGVCQTLFTTISES